MLNPTRGTTPKTASRRTSILTLIIAVVMLIGPAPGALAGLAAEATPPTQPASGPGGADYQWSASTVRYITFTDRTKDYWVFGPSAWQGSGPAPSAAPLVVLLHGWLGDDPKWYEDWITHLVRKGNVVIFPRYQTSALTPPRNFTSNAIYSLKHALAPSSPAFPAGSVQPDTTLGMTLIAHSYGGPVSANIAARWSAESLPQPKAILFAEPHNGTIDPSLAGIPATTKIGCLVGDVDTIVGRAGCDALWDLTGHVPVTNRNYLWMFNDTHGSPDLIADHRVPTSNRDGGVVNALDWYGIWKLGDALRNCGFFGTDCDYALGNTARQTSLGAWSDGVPVRPLSVSTTKPPCPPGSGAKGC
ncbi:hypothetical protein [Actinomadura sp. SCN-SB]|uniref:hypothetical protein n=1 Tax=Actinomadura sp. SCN-SB TaxID=3373092 RepID=UPI0037514B7E